MKKRDLLLAGLVLFNVSAFAQGVEVPRYKDDAKVIYEQKFEGSKDWQTKDLNLKPAPLHPNWHIPLYTWNINPVDSITKVEYYVKADENKQLTADIYDGSGKFEIAGTRDTVMYLYDGVMRTDASFADDSCLQWDTQYIEDHNDVTQKGETGIPGKSGSEYGLDRYGEDGGAQFFRYITATSRGVANRGGGSNGSHDEASASQDHYVPEYRRNLFVRNIPIEDSTSYRLTVFVKPTLNAVKQKGVKARIGVDLMRGYFHSEKSFQVNREGSSKVAFADKTDFTDLEVDKWNKITLMAYYTNDSLGDASAYDQTYYWNNDWDWDVTVDADGKVDATSKDSVTLRYIKQPDKYFVRLSFRSDSTTFDVDNLSLTKSWIGGVEYFQDMLRVDLGYETNLGKLTKEAQAKTNIPAVEIPGENFKIYGLYEGVWEPVPMLSAEYHGDGFMYAWTEPWDYDPETGDGDPRYFNEYDSVLVTFYNPVDAALELKYTGSRYPNGMNKEWIADAEKRRVFDFHNEIAYLNPTITISPVTKEAVSSLKDLAPVFQSAEIEDGAFGLDPNRREFTFKFSRNLSFDNLGEDGPANSYKTIVEVIGSNGKEFWDIKDYVEDGVKGLTTIVRRPEYTSPLAGDYTVSFKNVTHSPNPNPESKQDYGNPVTVNYHFGNFDTTTRLVGFDTNWDVEENEAEAVCFGTAIIDNNTQKYKEGDGKKGAGSRMYRQSPKGQFSCSYYLSPRGGSVNGQLYIGTGDDRYSINLSAGIDYKLTFMTLGWDKKAQTNVYIFPKPVEGTPADVKTEDKTKLGEFTPTNSVPNAQGRKTDYVVTTADTMNYFFTVPADGKYIVEFEMPSSGGWTGTLYSDIHITDVNDTHVGDLSDASVSRINKALDNAYKAIQSAEPGMYRGADYNNLVTVKGEGDGFIAAKVASKINLPSEYENEAKSIDAATSALKLHMDTVDAFYKALADAEKKLAIYADSLKDYALLVVVSDLQNVVDDYFTYDCSEQAPGQIAADIKRLTDAIAAVDARQALIDEFNSAVKAAKVVLDNPLAVNYAVLYDNLKDILDTADGFDAIYSEDEELKSITGQVNSAKDDLQTMIDGAEALLARIKALDNLAKSVKANYGDASDEIANRIANTTSDDEDLAKIMKSAIKLAIYDNIVNKGDTAVNLDVTGFIRNFNLYATPKIVERTNLKANDAKAKEADPDGANIQHVQHQWNNGDLNGKQPIWIMIEENDINDLYPGWTVYAYAAGNCMVTPDDDTYGKLKEGVALFDGQLAMDWNGKADLKTTVEDLPLGKYNLSVTLKQNTGSGTVLSATALDDTLGLVEYKGDTKSVNNIVVGDGNLNINFTLTSGSGWSQADNFKLTYYADTLFDYTSLLTEAKNEFDNIITVVDFAQIEAAGEYEYYTLNWIKVETPEKGQVYFRKNGNVVEKVIFK